MYLHPAPLARIARDLVSGTLDLLDYINEACDLLEKVDPQVKAFLPEPDRRSRLLKEGQLLKSIYPDQSKRPPLYGVLIGVKDVYRVDGFSTRGGSKLDPEALAGPEADCVRLLRQAGALVMGKTVTTEFAYFEPGPTRNPHNLNHTPGGSSSGSAAAVAAGFAPLTLGTQTIGSVNRPAAFCGVVGYKPSYNRIPSGGLLYFSRSADHVGCFTQDVEGMILAARALVEDWQDISVNYKPVLGVPRGKYLEQTSDEGLKAFSEQLERLRDAGYTVKEINALDDIETIATWHRKLIAAEIALEHVELYAKYAALYRPRTAEIIEEGKAISKDDLEEGRKRQKQLREKLETQMREAEIDLWVTPAAPGPAPEGIDATGNPAMNMPWTNAGLPSITIPAGRAENGLPLCLQFIAPFRGDELLLNWSIGIAELFPEYQAYNL
jgi:Asp-tRNA(Asn)/Glu-tRNA(Gln) amidotransferase A subunit family amidase